MKKWKVWLASGIMAAVLGISAMGTTVMAMGGGGVDRRDTVAEEETVRSGKISGEASGKATSSKAWKKINGVCYNGSGVKINGAITRGIDVSEWQDTIDWKKVKKSNVDFAFVRISYGLEHMDRQYAYNMKQAAAAGVPVGTYVYSLATTTTEALKEAQFAIKKMNGYKVSYPVVYDLEYSKMGELSASKIADLALAFCNEVKKAGYYPMVYCNTNWYDEKVAWSKLKGLDVWLARYGDHILAPDRNEYKYTIWQATDGDGGGYLNSTKGLISGISSYSDVDVDFGYVDYTKIITPRTKALATYKASKTPDTKNNVKNGWVKENGKTFYYASGVKKTGWVKVGSKYYYINATKGLYKSQLIRYNGNVFYVDKNGARVTSKWITWNKRKYYMKSNGYGARGMTRVGSKVYYFQKKYGYMMKNVRYMDDNDDVYYFGNDGVGVKSVFYTWSGNGEEHTYYFRSNGKMCRSWLRIKGKPYRFDSYTGIMYKNCTKIENGITYKFDKNGVCTNR